MLYACCKEKGKVERAENVCASWQKLILQCWDGVHMCCYWERGTLLMF